MRGQCDLRMPAAHDEPQPEGVCVALLLSYLPPVIGLGGELPALRLSQRESIRPPSRHPKTHPKVNCTLAGTNHPHSQFLKSKSVSCFASVLLMNSI